MFILAVHCPRRNLYTRGEKIQMSEQNARENVRNIDDYLTGKYAGPFAGIIESFRKIHRFTDVFWMQGDINKRL